MGLTPRIAIDAMGGDVGVRMMLAGAAMARHKHEGLRFILVGDEVLSVDGKPYHEIESFSGKVGKPVEIKLRRQAGAHYARAGAAQRADDWATYGAEMRRLGEVLRRLRAGEGAQ